MSNMTAIMQARKIASNISPFSIKECQNGSRVMRLNAGHRTEEGVAGVSNDRHELNWSSVELLQLKA